MSSIQNANESRESRATSTQAAETGEAAAGNASQDQEIRRRAYEIYLERGEQPGYELDDWLKAELELRGGALSRAQVG
jgi:Protein of unknown function (DUF2934)